MIRLEFQEPDTPDWNDWKHRAKEAADKMYDEYGLGKKPEVSETLYKEMKAILFSSSFGKCVYCETKIVHVDQQGKLTQLDQPGDVEHYRPKGKVTELDDSEVFVSNGHQSIPHPGYFWLAYDWKNLFLACKTCNSLNKDKETGKLYGKGTRFPLKDPKFRAVIKEAIHHEIPLFLHPYFDSMETHIDYVPKTGEMVGKTDEGKTTIDLLNLNRPGLVEKRKEIYDSVTARFAKADGAALDGSADRLLEQLQFLSDYEAGKRDYAMAGKRAIKDSADKLKPIYDLLKKYFQHQGQ
jgi:hypothetical protein